MFKRAVENKAKTQNIFETTTPATKKTQKQKDPFTKTPPPKKSASFWVEKSHSALQTGAHWNLSDFRMKKKIHEDRRLPSPMPSIPFQEIVGHFLRDRAWGNNGGRNKL